MKKIAALLVLAAGTAANADVVLNVDTSVVNQVTFTATSAVSSATASGPTFDGFLLANFFTAAGSVGTPVAGAGATLTANSVAADGTPQLFRNGADAGLNIWSYSATGTTTFTSGVQALTGTATWSVTPAIYELFLSANTSGNIYFAADADSDIPNAQIIGQYQIVPTPGAAAVLGLGGLAALRRRR